MQILNDDSAKKKIETRHLNIIISFHYISGKVNNDDSIFLRNENSYSICIPKRELCPSMQDRSCTRFLHGGRGTFGGNVWNNRAEKISVKHSNGDALEYNITPTYPDNIP